MFEFYADKSNLKMTAKEKVITSGSVNSIFCSFTFSSEWDGLIKTIVFKAGDTIKQVLLDDTSTCLIPWEVLEKPDLDLFVGVYGIRDNDIVLPTIWLLIKTIAKGVEKAPEADEPSPGPYEQVISELSIIKPNVEDNTERLDEIGDELTNEDVLNMWNRGD